MTRATAALLLLLAAAGSVTAAAAAGDGPPKVYPRTEDLPFIRCQVRLPIGRVLCEPDRLC